MKLTKENIDQIDKMLFKKHGVFYIDIRLELIDHLASELEQTEGNFEDIFPDFMESKKDFIRQTHIELNRKSSRKGAKKLFSNIFSLKFLTGYTLMTILVWYLVSVTSKEWFLGNFDILPAVIPIPISAILLYIMFFSKRYRSSEILSLISVNNVLFFGYLLWFIYIVRKMESNIWIPIFSFFMTLSIAYYFFYFQSLKEHNKKYKALVKQ